MGGYAHNRDAIEVAKKYKNIYIDTSEVPLVKEIRWLVDELGAERIFFGTDAPCCDPMVELKRYCWLVCQKKNWKRFCIRTRFA